MTKSGEMRIVFFELHDWEEQYLREHVDGAHEVVAIREVLEGEEAIYEESALLGDAVNPERLRQAIQNHVILKKSNVVFTRHNAFNSQEALERILQTTADNIVAFAAGTPKNVVK
jgi:lactate dehydrogenase-like 2-hydroxyacid dehydrogenase